MFYWYAEKTVETAQLDGIIEHNCSAIFNIYSKITKIVQRNCKFPIAPTSPGQGCKDNKLHGCKSHKVYWFTQACGRTVSTKGLPCPYGGSAAYIHEKHPDCGRLGFLFFFFSPYIPGSSNSHHPVSQGFSQHLVS